MSSQTAPTILVIDDQQSNVRMLTSLLVDSGFAVASALNGREGLDLARSIQPDVILLDIKMPEMDGFQVLAQLHEHVPDTDVPVIFLTADREHDQLVRAFAMGAIDYVTKPFMVEELLSRVRTHVALKQSRDALRRGGREKQEMAERVAHDLRNYLANIMVAADNLRDTAAAPEYHRQMLDSIQSSADSALLFLRAFLQQQSEQGNALDVDPLPCRQLINEVVILLEHSAQAKDISIDCLACEPLLVVGYRAGIIHVLQNLLSNAIKYSPPASTVTVAVVAQDGCARIQVMDRGPGISADNQRRLFQRFEPLASIPTAGENSTGLGLALARQQARAMGGDLHYEQREGGGSTFTFELSLV